MLDEVKGLRLIANHINRVQGYMQGAVNVLLCRLVGHDQSKYSDAERALITNKERLNSLTYNSPEYKAAMSDLRSAIDLHHHANSHHPEYYTNSVSGMSLFDLIEMLCDWKAAGEVSGGCIENSLEVGIDRFGIDPQLYHILYNTCIEMGWIQNGTDVQR